MKLRIHCLAPIALALVIVGFHCAPSKSQAAVRASIYVDNLYYDELDPYGDWNYVADYGWCWSPGYVSAGWRPYTVGYWAYSDWGWVWVSEDPWGDWPYHYGRWAFDASYGWVWVPGDVWAPAWVSWRYGSGWVGWAPLTPDVDWSFGVGIRYSSSSLDRRIVSGGWCFVPVNDFANRRIRGRVVPVSRNATLIQQTRNVTRYVDVNSRPVERGLSVDLIERAAGKRIPRYEISERSVRGRGGVQVRGRSITVSKPTRSVVRTANSRLQALPRDRADRGGRAVRENENASRRQNDARVRSDRMRQGRERDAEMRGQRNLELEQRRAVQERSQRAQERRSRMQEQRRQEERSQQMQQPRRQDQRSQMQERRSQVEERRSQQRQDQRLQQPEERQPRPERPSQQARERRPSQDRQSPQVEEQPPKQDRRSQPPPQQRRKQDRGKQDQERERRGRGGSGT